MSDDMNLSEMMSGITWSIAHASDKVKPYVAAIVDEFNRGSAQLASAHVGTGSPQVSNLANGIAKEISASHTV